MLFGITEISKMWVFPPTVCAPSFRPSMLLVVLIDLCDSSFIDSSLAVQYPRFTHQYLTNGRLYLTQK